MKHPFNTRNTITEPARRIQRYALVLPITRWTIRPTEPGIPWLPESVSVPKGRQRYPTSDRHQ